MRLRRLMSVVPLALVAYGQQTPALTTLYSFQGPPADGSVPGPLVMASDGSLFGVTKQGGIIPSDGQTCPAGCGTIFRLSPPASSGEPWTETVLYLFSGKDGDGATPNGVVIGPDGSLYGTTAFGGLTNCASGCGAVFRLVPPATPGEPWSETILHRFTGLNGDGYEPLSAPVLGPSGALWGTTYGGGNQGPPACGASCGTVYEVAPASGGSWKERILYRFTGQNGDGSNPYAGLALGAEGALYGTTGYGGAGAQCNGCGFGTVFELKPPAAPGGAWTESVLYRFLGDQYGDGALPEAAVIIGANGSLFGTTTLGGIADNCGGGFGCGTVFELLRNANGTWMEKVLHSSGGSSSALAESTVFFGTNAGGGPNCFNRCGSIFELAPPLQPGDAWRYGDLVGFNQFSGGFEPDSGVVIGPQGVLYGTAARGGNGLGTVFQLVR